MFNLEVQMPSKPVIEQRLLNIARCLELEERKVKSVQIGDCSLSHLSKEHSTLCYSVLLFSFSLSWASYLKPGIIILLQLCGPAEVRRLANIDHCKTRSWLCAPVNACEQTVKSSSWVFSNLCLQKKQRWQGTSVMVRLYCWTPRSLSAKRGHHTGTLLCKIAQQEQDTNFHLCISGKGPRQNDAKSGEVGMFRKQSWDLALILDCPQTCHCCPPLLLP